MGPASRFGHAASAAWKNQSASVRSRGWPRVLPRLHAYRARASQGERAGSQPFLRAVRALHALRAAEMALPLAACHLRHTCAASQPPSAHVTGSVVLVLAGPRRWWSLCRTARHACGRLLWPPCSGKDTQSMPERWMRSLAATLRATLRAYARSGTTRAQLLNPRFWLGQPAGRTTANCWRRALARLALAFLRRLHGACRPAPRERVCAARADRSLPGAGVIRARPRPQKRPPQRVHTHTANALSALLCCQLAGHALCS